MSKAKILIVDDEEEARFLWESTIRSFGYEVVTLASGNEALNRLDDIQPEMVLLDLNMPVMDGHDVCVAIKNKHNFSNLPVIILTSSDDLNDKLNSFEEGADDYITKEMEPQEIDKRIETVLRRYRKNLDSNPLTHLPGNNLLQREIQKKIDNREAFAVAYCDLDNFKAYNDCYGFVEGDKMILLCALVLKSSQKNFGRPDDFIGHIGDFVYMGDPGKIEKMCQAIISGFDSEVGKYYNQIDRERGYIVAKNRRDVEETFPLASISIAVVSNQSRQINSLAEVSKIASELKKAAKNITGSSYVMDKRQD